MKSLAARIGFLCFWLAGSAAAAVDAGAPEPDAGAPACTSSDDCSPPTAYCNTTLGKCVQCLADLNCFGVGYVCDQTKGVCTNCRSDADCYGQTPYCSSALARCVECKSDANCGTQGIKCVDGVCGSCGDGICSDNERAGAFGLCADCVGDCGKVDLGSKVGNKVASGMTSMQDAQTSSCGAPFAPTASFSWTAPKTGNYAFDAGGENLVSLIFNDCAGQPITCSAIGSPSSYLAADQKIAIIVTSSNMNGGSFALNINQVAPTCDPAFCPGGLHAEAACCLPDMTCGLDLPGLGCTAGNPDTGGVMACLGAVSMYGEPSCPEGTDCSCNKCPKDHLACVSTSGCTDIVACMAQYDCTGDTCNTQSRCAPIIDKFGGPNSSAYSIALGLAACDRQYSCQLACGSMPPGGSDAGQAGGGSGGAPSGATGGRAGASGGSDESGGVDGGELDIKKRTGSTPSGGCGCSFSENGVSDWAAAAALSFLTAAALRRKRRRP